MKSKTVKLVSGVAVLAVLFCAYLGVVSYVDSQEKKEAEAQNTSVSLVDIEPENITSVSFLSEDGEQADFEKEEDTWSKKGEEDFPVSQDTIDGAVNSLAALEADQELTEPEDLSEYDLDKPQNKIVLTTQDGSETVLLVGMKNEVSGQYYVKKPDKNNVYLVSETVLTPFMGNAYSFAEAEAFPTVTAASIKEVQVDKENGYTLSQDKDSLYWYVSDGKTSEQADTSKAGAVTSSIGSLTYGEFVDYHCTDPAKYGFDTPYAIISAAYMAETDTGANTDASEVSEQDESSGEEQEEAEETADTSEKEDTQTEKKLVICVGDEINGSRYVKVNDSNEVYTIPEESLTEILDKAPSDFYSLTVNYLTVNNLDSLEIRQGKENHRVKVVRAEEKNSEETKEDADEDESSDSPEKEAASEEATVTYTLDGKDADESLFTTFYNKLINMAGEKRLTETYTPEGEAAFTFVFTGTEGKKTTVSYYEYDSSFYAAVAGDKVYLVNKMNVKDLAEACEALLKEENQSSGKNSAEENASEDPTAAEETE